MNRKSLLLMAATAAVLLSGCNKDDEITPDRPDVDEGYRPVTSTSSPYQNKVFDYTPGPGQFINETVVGGFTGNESTTADAVSYAERRLGAGKFVSLGSFGGYIVVGFDHSILNSRRNYDIAVKGNAMDTSNEPGIVWVMKDDNRNGLPDDEWFELRGSETGKESTLRNYSVTYYRPSGPQMPVEWTDSDGRSGTVDYLKAYHKQDYYYPNWILADSYTLTGTRIEPQTTMDPSTGYWSNHPYDWGYADNMGSDCVAADGAWVGFRISNAMRADGSPADLDYVDFVKIQQSVLSKSGWLGENSCEVLGVADYDMLFK